MSAIAQRRCFHHPIREAVARCPACRDYYCRECVTEHDNRVICAGCLKKLTKSGVRTRSEGVFQRLAPIGGFLLAWWCFYLLGWLLA